MKQTESTSFDTENVTLPYLLFSLKNNVYGINSELVQGIKTLGNVTAVIESKPSVRGSVLHQNNFIHLIDMRKLFGLNAQMEDFEEEVQPDRRIKDHENWVSALEKSVLEHTEFTLTDDPHQCAFGRWYYSYKANNNVLMHQLKSIEAPHEAVHNTAKVIKGMMRDKKYESAALAVQELRATHFKTTLQLLSSLQKMVENSLRELYIVVEYNGSKRGIIVDSIVGVEYLNNSLQMPKLMSESKYIKFIGQRKKDDTIIFALKDSMFDD